jgi:hypothetical protein
MSLHELVDALANIALEEHLDDPDQLVQLMAERQALLQSIQQVDTSTLGEDERALLKERLQALLERDAARLTVMRELHEDARRQLDQLATGRAAVRGYGASDSQAPVSVRRIG